MKNYNLDNQYVGGAKEEKPPQPPLMMLWDAVDRVRGISSRLSDLSEKLVGTEVQGGGKPLSNPADAAGVFGDIERCAQEINDLAATMASHLSRIENRL